MNRRMLLRQGAGAAALAMGATAIGRGILAAQEGTPTADLAHLGLPEVTVTVDDAGFTVPSGATAGRLLMTVENTGEKGLHFFAARVPDDVSDDDLASDMSAEGEPAWFDMATLPMLGTPDWPAPGGKAQGVVDVTAGRWLLIDPIDGRTPALWTVGEAADAAPAPEPRADVEVGLKEMAFVGPEGPVPAGPRIWKITNQGAMEHELAILPVAAGTTPEDVATAITDMFAGAGDPEFFQPAGGQGVASKGVTSWQLFDLVPGDYAAVCMAPASGEDFVPHALMGMVAVFTVL